MTDSVFVSPVWLSERLRDPGIAIVDASYYLPGDPRDAALEHVAARIPGAVRFDIDAISDKSSPLPHMAPTESFFSEAVGALGISHDMHVVVYDGVGLFSAPRAWWTFRIFGAGRASILEGGLPAWRALGLPTESGPPAPRTPRRFDARLDRSALADVARVRKALTTGDAQVVDARSAERFAGLAPEPRPGLRSGHMPGALNLPYSALVRDGRLIEPEGVRAKFEQAGIDVERPVITTCGSGITAAILWAALAQIGRPPVALYDGSWAEWGARDDCAVVTTRA